MGRGVLQNVLVEGEAGGLQSRLFQANSSASVGLRLPRLTYHHAR